MLEYVEVDFCEAQIRRVCQEVQGVPHFIGNTPQERQQNRFKIFLKCLRRRQLDLVKPLALSTGQTSAAHGYAENFQLNLNKVVARHDFSEATLESCQRSIQALIDEYHQAFIDLIVAIKFHPRQLRRAILRHFPLLKRP